jgi:plasmid stabilization system protein ParE
MTYRVRVLPEAEREAEAAADWYEQRRPGLGIEFVAELVAVLDGLVESPERHGRLADHPAYRRARLRRFPFSAVFTIHGDEIEVVAVAHGRRFPGYWRR